jgi:hypothetical protein
MATPLDFRPRLRFGLPLCESSVRVIVAVATAALGLGGEVKLVGAVQDNSAAFCQFAVAGDDDGF